MPRPAEPLKINKDVDGVVPKKDSNYYRRSGLIKLRRATEFALGYPDVVINRGEASAVLDYVEELGGKVHA